MESLGASNLYMSHYIRVAKYANRQGFAHSQFHISHRLKKKTETHTDDTSKETQILVFTVPMV